MFRVVTGTLSSSATGTADFTVTGFGTVAGAIVMINSSTSGSNPNTAPSPNFFSMGYYDGTDQISKSECSTDNEATTTEAWKYMMSDKIGHYVENSAGTPQAEWSASKVTNGIRITTDVTDGTSYNCMVILIPADGVTSIKCFIQNWASGEYDANETIQVTDLGFEADLVFGMCGVNPGADSKDDSIQTGWGFCYNADGTNANIEQCAMGFTVNDNRSLGTTWTSCYASDQYTIANISNASGIRYGVRLQNFDKDGFDVRKWDDESNVPPSTALTDTFALQEDLMFLAIEFTGNPNVTVFMDTAPNATGNKNTFFSAGFEPEFGMYLMPRLPTSTVRSHVTAGTDSFAMCAFDAGTQSTMGYLDQDAAAATWCSTYLDTGGIQVYEDQNTSVYDASFNGFVTATSWQWNYSTCSDTTNADPWPALAIGAADEGTGKDTMRVKHGFLASGAAGTADFTIPDIGTIGGAIVYTNRASATNDPALAEGDTTWICCGFWDGTTQVVYAHHNEDGQTSGQNTDCWNAYSNNKIAYWCNNAGTTQFAATISSITDGVRITTNTSDGEAHRCMVVLIPSSIISNIDAQVIDRSGIDGSGVVEVTNVGFESDVVFVLGGRATANETAALDFTHSFGVAINDGYDSNYCMNLIEDDGRDLSASTTYLSNISSEVHCAMNNSNSGLRWGLRITGFDADGFTTQAWNEYVEPLTTNDTNAEDILALAIKFNGITDFSAYVATAPTATGNWAQVPPPQVVDVATFEEASAGTSSSDTHGFSLNLDDVIVCCVSLNTDSVTISDNNGANAFTPISARVDATTNSHRCFYWVVDDVADTAFDWTYGSSVGRGSRVYMQLRNVDTADVLSGTVTTGTSGTVGAAGTVDGTGSLAISFVTDDAASTSGDDLQWGSDYYEYRETNGATGQSAGVATRLIASGAPPSHTVTGAGAQACHTHFAVNPATGFAPTFGLVFGSEGVPDIGSGDGSNAESFSVMPFDGTNMHSFGYNSGDNLATVTTSAYSLSGWRQVENNGVPGTDDTFEGDFSSFDTEGFTMNFTAVPGTLDRWPIFLLGTYSAGGGPSGPSDAAIFLNSGDDNLTINSSDGSDLNTDSWRSAGGGTVTINANVSVTFSGLVANTEVRVYATADGTELAGVENSTTTFVASIAAATSVYYTIHHKEYEHIRVEGFTWPTTTTTLPIQQRFDSNYVNN